MAAAWLNALADPEKARTVSAGTERAQMLVTMGCGEQCPVVPGLIRDDWSLEDPKGKPLSRVREIRDEVEQRVERLVEDNGWAAK